MPTRTKANPAFPRLTRLGGPQAGTVAALALAQTPDETTLLLGTQVGLFRSVGFDGAAVEGWERLSGAPIGVVSLAVSPSFATDQTVVAGAKSGLYVSRDGGDTWEAAPISMAGAMAITLAFSPNYPRDGVLLAGTLEDGAFYSDNRGASWQRKSFGLVDGTVYGLGFSPNFGRDETVFAGTDTTVYYSYNGARAWKALPFPDEAAPALSVAVSPAFADDGTVYVGTEQHGLYRSTDRGQTWETLGLPAVCVNALLVEATGALLAGTDSGLYRSSDRGDTWQPELAQPNVISLAAQGGLTVAGLVDQGAWMSPAGQAWQPVPNLAARSLVGLALSPQFERDRTAFMFGPQEAPWRSTDGGTAWTALDADDASAGVQSLVLSPDFASDRTVAAASPAGVLLSTDAGEHWQTIAPAPAGLAAFSPSGKLLAASILQAGLVVSSNRGQTWLRMPGPWAPGSRVVALAMDNAHLFHVATVEGVDNTLNIWQGRSPDPFEQVLSVPGGQNPIAALYLPAEPAPDRPWYAAVGNQVWKFSARRGRAPVAATVFEPGEQGDSLLALAGAGGVLLAATGRQVFKSTNGADWTLAYDFGHDRALSLALSPTYAQDKLVYVLLLGGALGRIVVR